MHQPIPKDLPPEIREKLERIQIRDRKVERRFRRVLHYMELAVAAITVLALISSLCIEIYELVSHPGTLTDLNHFLHNILTVVVGIEFVRMIIDTTPSNILEVLTVAITRHVILSHDDPWSNLACIACIAGLFATRRFLIRRHELKTELVEEE